MSAEATSGRPRRRSDLRIRDADGFSDVIDVGGNAVYRLNDTARALWEICDGETTFDEMLLAAGQLFDAPEDLIRADLQAAIAEFRRRGLLEEPG